MNNNILFNEMIEKQLPNVLINKLSESDIQRITNKLNDSIFNNNCVLYQGVYYKKNNKFYIPFYYNYKKISLTRVLYINYVESVNSNTHIKYTCNNKGLCCCLNHMILSKTNINTINNNNNNNNDNDNNIVTF